jgi:hypothetical protein
MEPRGFSGTSLEPARRYRRRYRGGRSFKIGDLLGFSHGLCDRLGRAVHSCSPQPPVATPRPSLRHGDNRPNFCDRGIFRAMRGWIPCRILDGQRVTVNFRASQHHTVSRFASEKVRRDLLQYPETRMAIGSAGFLFSPEIPKASIGDRRKPHFTRLLRQRQKMAQDWADYLDRLVADDADSRRDFADSRPMRSR